MKTGLVMEGGAMRGMYTAGVTDIMIERGLTFDGAVGVSAGAVFGCNVKSRQNGRSFRYNLKYAGDPRYCSIRSLLTTGDLYGTDFCYREIPEELDPFDTETYQKNPMPFYVVCTDVLTGRPVYHRVDKGDRSDMDWFRASASMPLASRIVHAGGMKLLDGGIADSIPLRFMQRTGYEKNVVILTQPADYVKKATPLQPAIAAVYARYPALVKAMATRHLRYNRDTAYVRQEEEAGRVMVFRPETSLGIGHTESDRGELLRVYEMGRAAAESRLDELKAFLDSQV